MPNNITGNPWFIDTVGFQYKDLVYIKNLLWNEPTAGATLVILDNQGRTIINTTANAADPAIVLGEFRWVQGFNLVTMSSGNLSVVIHK